MARSEAYKKRHNEREKARYHGNLAEFREKRRLERLQETAVARTKRIAYMRQYYKDHRVEAKLARRKYCLKKKFGLSYPAFLAMLDAQDWTCPITGQQLTIYSPVDHCHESGKVRAVLSQNGNAILAAAHDAIAPLQRAVELLKKTGTHKPARTKHVRGLQGTEFTGPLGKRLDGE